MGEGKQAWGWYPAGNIWVPLQVAATGKLVIDPTAVFEEPPTLGELEKGATSNWCNLHAADADAHHDAFTPADHQADPHTMTLDGVDLSAHAVDVDAHHGAFTPADHTAIGDGAPHHARYTDAEALLVAAPLAHHARHEAGGADALANPIAIAAMPNLTSTKIWQGNGGNRPTEVDLPVGVSTFAALTDVKFVCKAADETVNNSIVMQNDDHLFFAVAANEIWAFELQLILQQDNDGAAYAKHKYAFSVPAASIINRMPLYHTIPPGIIVDATGTVNLGSDGLPVQLYWAKFLYRGGANAGTVQMQWAQQIAKICDTKILKGSVIIAHRLA